MDGGGHLTIDVTGIILCQRLDLLQRYIGAGNICAIDLNDVFITGRDA